MKRQQAFKFQLLPNGEQQRKMRQFAGCCRWVFNEALGRQVEQRENDGKFISYVKMTHWLVEWKNSAKHCWLAEAPSQVLQQALKNLERAYKNLFAGRASFPNKHKRGKHDSFRYPQGIKLEQQNSPIFLPKLGWLRYRNSRKVQGIVKKALLQTARAVVNAGVNSPVFDLEVWHGCFQRASLSRREHPVGSALVL